MYRSARVCAVLLFAGATFALAADPPPKVVDDKKPNADVGATTEEGALISAEKVAAALRSVSPKTAEYYNLGKVEADKNLILAEIAERNKQNQAKLDTLLMQQNVDSKAGKATPEQAAKVKELFKESTKLQGELGMANYYAQKATSDREQHEKVYGKPDLPPELKQDLAARAAPTAPPLSKRLDLDPPKKTFNDVKNAVEGGPSQLFDGSKQNKGDDLNPKSGTRFFGIKPNPGSEGQPSVPTQPASPKTTSLPKTNPFISQDPSTQPATAPTSSTGSTPGRSQPPSSGDSSGKLKDAATARDKKAEEQKYYDRLLRDGEWQTLELEQADIKAKLAANKSERDTVDFLAQDFLKRCKDHQRRLEEHERTRSSIGTQAEADAFNRVIDDINGNKALLEKEQLKLIDRTKKSIDDLLAIEKKDRQLRTRKADHAKKWAYLDGK